MLNLWSSSMTFFFVSNLFVVRFDLKSENMSNCAKKT